MAKRRPSGDGMVRKREDGRWEGRIVVGHKASGEPIFRYIYADTQKELTAKLRQNIDAYQGVDLTEESRLTLAEWLAGGWSKWRSPSGPPHWRDTATIWRSTLNPTWGTRISPKSRQRICGISTTPYWSMADSNRAPVKVPASPPPPSTASIPRSIRPFRQQLSRE